MHRVLYTFDKRKRDGCPAERCDTPGEGHLLGVQQVIEAFLHNVQLHIALLQLLQQIRHL